MKTRREKSTYKCGKCGHEQDRMEAFMIRESSLCFRCYNDGPGKDCRAIREEDDLDEAWFKKAGEVRAPEELGAFMRHVVDGYVHDYGTVCKAIAACAVAAAWCANRMRGASGGITGFQAGAVCGEFIRRWQGIEGPFRIVEYGKMLYPQHEESFSRLLDGRVADWLRDEARKKLAEKDSHAAPEVREHWEKMAEGWLPFGYERAL